MSVLEKKVEEPKDEVVEEDTVQVEEQKVETKEQGNPEIIEQPVVQKEKVKVAKKKNVTDENQISIDLTSVPTKKAATSKVKESSEGKNAEKPVKVAEKSAKKNLTTPKKVKDAVEDEDSELLIKPVKSSRRKVK